MTTKQQPHPMTTKQQVHDHGVLIKIQPDTTAGLARLHFRIESADDNKKTRMENIKKNTKKTDGKHVVFNKFLVQIGVEGTAVQNLLACVSFSFFPVVFFCVRFFSFYFCLFFFAAQKIKKKKKKNHQRKKKKKKKLVLFEKIFHFFFFDFFFIFLFGEQVFFCFCSCWIFSAGPSLRRSGLRWTAPPLDGPPQDRSSAGPPPPGRPSGGPHKIPPFFFPRDEREGGRGREGQTLTPNKFQVWERGGGGEGGRPQTSLGWFGVEVTKSQTTSPPLQTRVGGSMQPHGDITKKKEALSTQTLNAQEVDRLPLHGETWFRIHHRLPVAKEQTLGVSLG